MGLAFLGGLYGVNGIWAGTMIGQTLRDVCKNNWLCENDESEGAKEIVDSWGKSASLEMLDWDISFSIARYYNQGEA